MNEIDFPIDYETCRGEYIFLVDKSGSMNTQNRIEKAKESLTFFLKSLPASTIFNICSYGTDYNLTFEQS